MFKYLFYAVVLAMVFMGQFDAGCYESKKTNLLSQALTRGLYKNQSNQNGEKAFDKTQNPYPNNFVILGNRPQGMFSIFDDVFDLIKRYEIGHYKGIEVDFDDQGLYYEPSRGKNWWSYYCKPVSIGKKNNIKKIMYPNKPRYIIFLKKEDMHRKEIFNSIQKYFQVKPNIQTKIDVFEKENFKDYFVISVHYRGTDKKAEASHVPYEKVPEEIFKVMKTYGNKKYKIFVATDEQAFLNYMITLFGDRVCYNKDALRSTNGKPIHKDKNFSRYKCGEDAIIDCILLSKGSYLIRTSSNLSRWSTYFNPNIPGVKLNSQFLYEKIIPIVAI